MSRAPPSTASENRGAGPASPRLTAADSRVFTAPAPISRSAARPPMGTVNRCRSLTRRRIRARIKAMGTQLYSGASARSAPSGTRAARLSRSSMDVIGG